MDWSKAKTMFIITFLILNIFLLYQLIKQENENKYAFIQETPMEERLRADEITVPELPTDPKTENYVEARAKKFHRDDFNTLSGQEFTIINDSFVQSNLSSPYSLKGDWQRKDIDLFVQKHVYEGSQYTYWDYDKEKGRIIYYQTHQNKTFYKNENGEIVIQLDDDGNIESYSQTMLENIKEIKEQNILTANQALLILYNKQYIRSGSEITKVDLGYYTLVPILSSQLLVPTWRFEINGTDNFFVNAVEGSVFQETEKEEELLELPAGNEIP